LRTATNYYRETQLQLNAETATATEKHGYNIITETSLASVEPPREEDERAICALVHLLQLRDPSGLIHVGTKTATHIKQKKKKKKKKQNVFSTLLLL
jgi:hypothetical protein